MRRQGLAVLVASVLMALAPAVSAREAAPLPASFSDVEGNDGPSTLPPVRGIYARGIAGGTPLDGIDLERPVCIGTDDENQAVIERLRGQPAAQYWFYATAEQGVLFVRELRLVILPGYKLSDCARAVYTRQEIERAYVADGYIHSFTLDSNSVPGLASQRLGRSANEYSGSFDRLTSLMARRDIPRRASGDWREREEAGIPVLCLGRSGLVWNETCYAANGPARGMLIYAAAGDDVAEMFSNRVLEVYAADLPGAVFDVARDWRLLRE